MPKPLSADIRSRFRRLFDEVLSGREIACRLMMSAATASRLAQKIRRGASLAPAPNRRETGRGRLAPFHDFLIELIHHDPDITLRELTGALEQAHGGAGVDLACQRRSKIRPFGGAKSGHLGFGRDWRGKAAARRLRSADSWRLPGRLGLQGPARAKLVCVSDQVVSVGFRARLCARR
jgi:transposase